VASAALAVAAACALVAGSSPSPATVLPDVRCQGKQVEVIFLDKVGHSRIVGTPGPDVIYGGHGSNLILGKGGNDTICGGPGGDAIDGGPGDDDLDGDDDRDEIDGGKGRDRLIGSEGPDVLRDARGKNVFRGNGGADHIRGGPDADNADGGQGNDVIHVEGGADDLGGSGGDDKLFGGAGGDEGHGGSGEDLLDGEGGADQLFGGDDKDVIAGGAGDDLFLEGQDGPDHIAGEDGRDELGGGDGNDTLSGGPGHDFMTGDRDKDICGGGPGIDRCNGGAPSPANIATDPDTCRKDVEIRNDCRGPVFPRTWQLTASGTYTHDGLSETWNATITLRRSYQDAYGASYYYVNSTGQIHWSVQGQNDNNCTVSGGGDFAGQAELGLTSDPGGYAMRVRPANTGPINTGQTCPPPQGQQAYYVQPLNDPDAAWTSSQPYEEGDTTLSGSRTYPAPLGGTATWQWSLAAGD
jgi:hypothetical protein